MDFPQFRTIRHPTKTRVDVQVRPFEYSAEICLRIGVDWHDVAAPYGKASAQLRFGVTRFILSGRWHEWTEAEARGAVARLGVSYLTECVLDDLTNADDVPHVLGERDHLLLKVERKAGGLEFHDYSRSSVDEQVRDDVLYALVQAEREGIVEEGGFIDWESFPEQYLSNLWTEGELRRNVFRMVDECQELVVPDTGGFGQSRRPLDVMRLTTRGRQRGLDLVPVPEPAFGLPQSRTRRQPGVDNDAAALGLSSRRVSIDEIDSFSEVRCVTTTHVSGALEKGRVDALEEDVKDLLVEILDVPLKPKDHGGELADLYTANLMLSARRTPTAFLLKGRGTSGSLTLNKCGHDGGQVVRLFDMPAELFVVQYVGPIDHDVIRDVEQKTDRLRLQGGNAWYCIIDGQDTARLMRAYGKL